MSRLRSASLTPKIPPRRKTKGLRRWRPPRHFFFGAFGVWACSSVVLQMSFSPAMRSTTPPAITVISQADASIQVGFAVSGGGAAQDANVKEHLTRAYQRRMGR